MTNAASGKKHLDNAEPQVTIGTHNGCFHCDEAMACYLLQILPKYKDAKIVRTRDNAKLELCDVVVDVGGVYDPGMNRFDHHQREFAETFNSIQSDKPWKIKLSSAGLIYVHFGRQVIAQMAGLTLDDPFVDKAYCLMYENFIMEIDAIDNGVKQYPAETEKPLYTLHTGLSARVGHLNSRWNAVDPEPEDELFKKAVALTGGEFAERLMYYKEAWWPARQVVAEAFAKRFEHDPEGGRLLVLDACKAGLPWKSHLFEIEHQADCLGSVLFALYRDTNGSWRVQAVPLDETGGFENRLPLKADWRGLRDDELSAKCGVEGCVFVHSAGFIGGNKSFEGAKQMALLTMTDAPREDAECQAKAS